jgi:acyl carrier protein
MLDTVLLKKAFAKGLNLEIDQVNDGMTYQAIENWDSIGHMSLIASIEDTFDIMLSTNDVIDLSSFEKAKEIIAKYL